MLSDAEINFQKDPDTTRLNVVSNVPTTLTYEDVDTLVAAFRTVLGSIEKRDNMKLQETLEAIDDSSINSRGKAAKMAAIVLRLQNEDFGVALITDGITNSDEDQRKLFIIYAISELWQIPDELVYLEDYIKVAKLGRKTSNSAKVTRIP